MISDTDVVTVTGLGNGINTSHSIGFDFADNDDVRVFVQDEGEDPWTSTELVYGAGAGKFTITGGDPGTTVVMGTALASDQRAIIRRDTPEIQPVQYTETSAFPASDHEEQQDRLVRIAQEAAYDAGRAIKMRESSNEDPPYLEDLTGNAGMVIVVNDDETALEPSDVDIGDIDQAVTDAQAAAAAAATSETNAASSATAAAASAAAAALTSGAYIISGTHSAPNSITAAGGITAPSNQRTKMYVKGNSGAVDITKNPQISAGTIDGQELMLIGCDSTNTLELDNGTGLVMQGPMIMIDGSVIKFNWDNTQALWVEENRNAIE